MANKKYFRSKGGYYCFYTKNPDKVSTTTIINSKTTDKVESIELINWTTKEQDKATAEFIEETLKDL